ncbi:uncharacterized protein LOC124529784 [Vanessa cardui]|uniref:uncharacterized protein LOC124529784 n=1 Tax=Vanessa cardui TaxID=171605 RepID=UPI001F13BE13|nr:uncharacterized protein LOC124529784 [Vanessa cardui]
MILIIWTVVLIAVLTLFLRQKYSKFSNYGIKHLSVVPFFGNMFKIFLLREHFVVEMERLYNKFSNERFVGRYEFIKPVVVLQDLELIKRVTVKDFEYFLDHRGFTDGPVEPLFARNLFSLKGQEWKDMRSTLSPAFTSSKIKLMIPFMEEVGEQMIRAIKKKLEESESGSMDIDVKDLTSRFTNDVIASCAFGLKVNSHADENNQFYEMGKTASTFKVRQMLFFIVMSIFPIFASILNLKLFSNETKNFFENLVMGTMKDREHRSIVRPDMIHLLMEAKKGRLTHDESNGINKEQDTGFATVEESSVGKKTINRVWSDTDLIAQAVLFFVAGFETVSIAMSFTLHELAINPEVQDRLVKEIKEYDAKNGGKLNFSSIQNMTYLDMVTSESLRLWPPMLALDRVCVKDYNMGKPNPSAIKDYIMRKGEILTIPVWNIHRDPKLFPNPHKFDPERFSEDNKHNINPMTYLPFGIGPRNCIGSRFALCELKVLLYLILLHNEVSISEKTRLPVRLAPESISPKIDGGHWLKFKARDMILLIWSIALIAMLALYLNQIYSRFSSYGVKHFTVVPLLGNMLNLALRKTFFAEEMDRLYKLYPKERFVGRYEFTRPVLVLQDLELIKTITVKDFEYFTDHRQFIDEEVEPLFGRNLFSIRGEEWKDMRSTLSPAFTSSKIKLMVPFMEEVGKQMIQALKKQIQESDSGSIEVDTRDLTSRYANDVIASCAFGLKVDSHTDKENQFYIMGKDIASFTLKKTMSLFIISIFPNLAKKFNLKLFNNVTKNFFIDLVTRTMKDRESRNIMRPDMIHLLMEAKKGQLTHDDKNKNDNQDTGFSTVEESSVGMKKVDRIWSDTDLIAQAILFFIAGFDTISTAMTFALYELALHPDIQERLVKEIKEHYEKNNGTLNINSIQNMTYMDMVTSEALRLWPPVAGLDRSCVKDYNMGKPNSEAVKDYIVRKGELVSIPVWSFHRDANIFPNPEKFDPERFSYENRHNINTLAYMPFGVGPRNCIGSRFALCEMKALLYQILLHIEISPSARTCIPAKLSCESFNLALVGGHWLKFKLRN